MGEQRADRKCGGPESLPKRERGSNIKCDRDYLDSKRLLSNYLLLLCPIMLVPILFPKLDDSQIVILVALVVLIIEWYTIGKRIRSIAIGSRSSSRERGTGPALSSRWCTGAKKTSRA